MVNYKDNAQRLAEYQWLQQRRYNYLPDSIMRQQLRKHSKWPHRLYMIVGFISFIVLFSLF